MSLKEYPYHKLSIDVTKLFSNQISLKKEYLMITFLDLAKVFDSVDCTKLLNKLGLAGGVFLCSGFEATSTIFLNQRGI